MRHFKSALGAIAFLCLVLGEPGASSNANAAVPCPHGPSSPCYQIITLDHVDENGISGMPYDSSANDAPDYVVDLAWARIMYPADHTGQNPSVSTSFDKLPIVMFVHGKHSNCDNDGAGPGMAGGSEKPGPGDCNPSQRVPSHLGYDYIMEKLADRGYFVISINTHEIQDDQGTWNLEMRGRLILKWLDILKYWNDNSVTPWGDRFEGKLDLDNIGLSGHSRGGEGVVAAEFLNNLREQDKQHSILAINAIAPTDHDNRHFTPTHAAYFVLLGARDGDVWTMDGIRTYDRSFSPDGPIPNDKMMAVVYGANHNYFNTIWTDTAALGRQNNWTQSGEDYFNASLTVGRRQSAAAQRLIAEKSIIAFFDLYLKGEQANRAVLVGERTLSATPPLPSIFWTFQGKDRRPVDNFEQVPPNPRINTLQQRNVTSNLTIDEAIFHADPYEKSKKYDFRMNSQSVDKHFFHETVGLQMEWAGQSSITFELPNGFDASRFSYLSFRAAKIMDGTPSTGPDVRLKINLQDRVGNSLSTDVRSELYARIPHPYLHEFHARMQTYNPSLGNNQSLMSGIRIPLALFSGTGSTVDIGNLARVVISTEGSGRIGIDDIEFTN